MITTKVAKHVKFEGYVQGVGFRYTANSLARRYSVTGYVMNMPDGSVEVLAEGPNEEVDSFIHAIREEMGEYIHDTKIQDCSVTGQYTRFSVKF
jgi:acylphosphatase